MPTNPDGGRRGVLGEQRPTQFGVAETGDSLVVGQGVQRTVRRAEHERVGGRLQTDEHADRADPDLRLHVGTGFAPSLDGREQLAEAVGSVVVLLHGEAQRSTDLGGDAAEEFDLVGDEFVVGRLVGVGDQLDDAGAGAAERRGDPEHLVGARPQRPDLLTA